VRLRSTNEHNRTRGWLLAGLLAVGPLLGLYASFVQTPGTAQAVSEEPTPPEPVVLQADAGGLALEWRAPVFTQRKVSGDDGRSYVALHAPGWEQSQAPGQPQLPFASVLLVAPPSGEVTLRVQVLERKRFSLSHPLAPAPRLAPVGDPPVGLEPTWTRDRRAYAGSGLPPAEIVTLEEAGQMRGRRLVRLTFSPLRFDPAGPAVEVARHVRVVLTFEDAGAVEATGWAKDDIFTPILQQVVVNPEQTVQFARPPQTSPVTSAPSRPDGSAEGLATPALASSSAPSDTQYLIIAHSSFIDAVAPLAAHRAVNDGLTVYSTTVEAIGGSNNPTAIRDYISNTYHSPPTLALEYVLLVGDGVESGSSGQYVPPYMMTMDPSWRPPEMPTWEAASDNWFASVDGDDNVADVAIGRLPVNSPAEAQTVVQKILDYDLAPPQNPWNKRVLIFAGNEDEGSGGDFHTTADQIYATLPVTFAGQRAYFCTPDVSDCNAHYKYDDITVAHDVVMGYLNGGGLLASYVGHSSWDQWAVDPATFAPLFHVNDDVPNLHNGGALPVFLGMTCYTGRFSYSGNDTLDESLLRRAGGGAVATWGSTSLGRTSGHNVLHQRFFHAVFQDGDTELGSAIQFAKSGLIEYDDSDLIDTFVLLGDPAMNLNMTIVPWTDQIFLPLVMRGN